MTRRTRLERMAQTKRSFWTPSTGLQWSPSIFTVVLRCARGVSAVHRCRESAAKSSRGAHVGSRTGGTNTISRERTPREDP